MAMTLVIKIKKWDVTDSGWAGYPILNTQNISYLYSFPLEEPVANSKSATAFILWKK